MFLSLKNKSAISLPNKEKIKRKLQLHVPKDSSPELPSSPFLESKRGSDTSLRNNTSSNNVSTYTNNNAQVVVSSPSRLPSNSSSDNSHSRSSSSNLHKKRLPNANGISVTDAVNLHHSHSQSQLISPITQSATSNSLSSPFPPPLALQSADTFPSFNSTNKHKPPSSANSSYFHLPESSKQESLNSATLNNSNSATPGVLYIDIPPNTSTATAARSSHVSINPVHKQGIHSSRDPISSPSYIGSTAGATNGSDSNIPSGPARRRKKGLSKIIKTRFEELDHLISDNLEKRLSSIEMENLKLIETLNSKYLNLININETLSTNLNRLNNYVNELNERSSAQVKRKSHTDDLFNNLNDLSARLETVKSSLSENKKKLDGFNTTLVEFQNFKQDSQIKQTKKRNIGFICAGLVVLVLILHHLLKSVTA